MRADDFNNEQMALALKLRRVSIEEVSTQLGFSRRTISAYLNGSATPTAETVEQLANVLEVPVTFFFRPRIEMPEPYAVSFRALSRMPAGDRDAARAFGGIAVELAATIAAQFVLPDPDVPIVEYERDPETAADYVRELWGRGVKPIPNMVHLLEHHGVRIFSLAIDSDDVDAFSMWQDETPYIFLNTRKSAERSRFDAAHELGHLVLHRHGALHQRDAEHEAQAFASAFLMPKASVLGAMSRRPTIATLIEKKKLWGVSVTALAYRCHKLGLYTDWEYRSLNIELGKRGYRTSEPEPIQRESSQVFRKVMALLYEDGGSKAQLAGKLSIATKDVDTLLFGLAMTTLPGGRPSPEDRPRGERPGLRLVQ